MLPATTLIYTISLHDALPIFEQLSTTQSTSASVVPYAAWIPPPPRGSFGLLSCAMPLRMVSPRICVPGPSPPPRKNARPKCRSEEHTSELQSLRHLVCRLLLE